MKTFDTTFFIAFEIVKIGSPVAAISFSVFHQTI
jgi:hypothetical protein